MMKHILRSQQFDRPTLEAFMAEAHAMQHRFKDPRERPALRKILKHRMMLTLFYEPSTRTRISFEAAARHLGMQVITTENASEFSSVIKGETLEDSIRVLSGYGIDAIVIRHREAGAADRAAHVSDMAGFPVSIINGGDGTGQHPTQALLDFYTIWCEAKAHVEGLTVVIGGDLAHGRTARSLAYLLSRYSVKIRFLSPPELTIGRDITDHLKEHGIAYEESSVVDKSTLGDADVVYWTRVQRERISNPSLAERTFGSFTISTDTMKLLRKDAILMHPLPRVDEISKAVDDDPRAAFFRQAHYGLFVRMAILKKLLGHHH